MSRRHTFVSTEARQLAIRMATATARRLEAFGLVVPPGRRPSAVPHDAMVVMPARGEILYRLLSSGEARERDFFSNRDKDRPAFTGHPYVVHCGVSMYEHPDQALLHANRYPLAVAP